MPRFKINAVILLSFVIGVMAVFSPSSALSFFERFAEKAAAIPFKEKFLAFQGKMPEDRVYLSCDKPFYFPGETVWFAAYVRNAADMKPSVKSQILHVEWIAPSGNVAKEIKLIARNGVAQGDIALDESMPGGIYRLKAYTSWQKNSPAPAYFVKEIPVQRVVLPVLKMKLDFMKKAYGPGDTVEARLDVNTREDQPYADKDFQYTVRLGGTVHKEYKGKTRGEKGALIRFSLPDNLDTADGVLSIVIPYEGKNESIARSIPILSTKLDVGIYPEGGDLVDGIFSKVAVRVRDEFGKPADVSAEVVTDDGKTVAEFDTFHKGMGSFNIKPEKARNYALKIVRPKGVKGRFPLPACLEKGYTLEAKVVDGKRADLVVRSTEKEPMTVTVRSRGNQYDEQTFMARKGENRLSFNLESFPMGVVQITLFDSKNIERAERLCFIQPKKQMKISIQTDRKTYGPREKVNLTVKTTDERGIPVPAQLTLSVVDDSLIAFADDRQGSILSKLLLEPDITGEVFEPSFYFDEKEKKRDEALDLLMLTQGWRRFTWKAVLGDEPPAIAYPPERAEIRGVVMTGRGNPQPAAGAKVTVESSGKSVVTDEQGAFLIRDLDLYHPETLIASKGGQTGSPVLVRDYDNAVTLDLSPIMFDMGIKGGAGDDMIPAPMAAGGPADPAFMPKGGDDEKALIFVQPSPVAVAAVRPGKEEDRPSPVVMEIIDPRFLGKPGEGRVLVEGGPTAYTRARVFPETVYETTETSQRSDFRSTIFFKGLVETDRRGVARLAFHNSDAVTSFRATVEGIGSDGLVGRAEQVYTTRLPFALDVKVPVSVSMGDELSLPLTLTNKSGKALEGEFEVSVPQGFRALGPLTFTSTVEDGESRVIYLPYIVSHSPGKTQLRASFTAGGDTDTVVKDILVAPRGFPVSIALSSQEADRSFDLAVEKPVSGSLRARFTAYPTVLSDLVKGIESILQEPYGCFEQASSSTYPNILVLDYLKEQSDPDPAVMKKAHDLIAKGYNRLTAYETKEKGYEWFGENPGHEALTAYGLMEFKDMERVYPGVDGAMVKRTENWLLSRRDGKGGFARNEKALDSFGRASADITNAYIVYALSEAGYTFEIKAELEKAVAVALKSADPYQLALVANALFNMKDPRKDEVLKTLLTHRKEDGSFTGKTTSVTCSTGSALAVETTSLAVLALLKSEGAGMTACEPPVRYIVSARTAYGGFGNTQSTVLALKALSAFARFSRRTAEDGRIEILVNGKPVAEAFYTKGQTNEVLIPETELSGHFAEGPAKVRVVFHGVTHPLPYTFSLTYNTFVPSSSGDCPLKLQTELKSQDVRAGNPVRMTVTLTNTAKDKGQPMSLAVIGIPGGLSLLPWQLKELQDKKVVDYLEILGSNLVVYYRQLKPGETKTIPLDLKGEVPGIYEAAASSAYLYYGSENRIWIKGERVRVGE